jgi:hypothetical protein
MFRQSKLLREKELCNQRKAVSEQREMKKERILLVFFGSGKLEQGKDKKDRKLS